MWTNDEGFIGCDEYDPSTTNLLTFDEYWFDAELLDYQNGLYLRLLQLTNNLWMTCLITQH